MAKGYQGQSCAEAIRQLVRVKEPRSFSELFVELKKLGDWKDNTIYQQIMASVVNLPPARNYWPSDHAFLFLRHDGRFELYDRGKHPETIA